MRKVMLFVVLVNVMFGLNEFELLTNKIYTSKYISLKDADTNIAEVLYPLTLQEAVNKGYITKNMSSLALPVGIMDIEEGFLKVDYLRGMEDMWNYKKGIDRKEHLKKLRERFVNKFKLHSTKTSLRQYRSEEITYSTDLIKRLLYKKKSTYTPQKANFMQIIIDNLTQNVLLGYNIQELLPPAYKNIQINPVFKAYYLDRLFKEAGKEFIEGFPARYDTLASFGPFQMTNIAMGGVVRLNKYLNKVDKLPSYVQDFKHLQHHTDASAVFAYYNWELMANTMAKFGVIDKFNYAFPLLSRKNRQIFVAGITACMHHLPTATRNLTAKYIKNSGSLNNLHYMVRRKGFVNKFQLQKYYDSAAESYLLLKVFHILEKRYSAEVKHNLPIYQIPHHKISTDVVLEKRVPTKTIAPKIKPDNEKMVQGEINFNDDEVIEDDILMLKNKIKVLDEDF